MSPKRNSNPQRLCLQAVDCSLEEIAAHVGAGRNFAFETTLSGLTYATMIPRWRLAGYRVKLLYLSLASANEAVARVALYARVATMFPML